MRFDMPSGVSSSPGQKSEILLHFGGTGAAFSYSLGYARYVAERFALDREVHISGVSGGALVAACLALKLDLSLPGELAFAYQQRLADRKLGLFGAWKTILYPYYRKLLPDRIRYDLLERLHIKVTFLNGKSEYIDRFRSKDDLIETILASQHIPFFLDLRPWTIFRGRRCIDADILAKETYPPIVRKAIISPYHRDETNSDRIGYLESIRRQSIENIRHLQSLGYTHGQKDDPRLRALGLKDSPNQPPVPSLTAVRGRCRVSPGRFLSFSSSTNSPSDVDPGKSSAPERTPPHLPVDPPPGTHPPRGGQAHRG